MNPLQQEDNDQLHVGLAVPRHSAKQIHNWVREQQWPEGTELEHPKDYHVTLLFAQNGHRQHKNAWWIEHMEQAPVTIKGITAFPSSEKGGYAYVLLLDSPQIDEKAAQMQGRAKWQGLEVPEFKGGYKIHLTVAYGPSSRLTGIKPPNFQFDVGPSSVSPLRPKSSAVRVAFDPEVETRLLDHLSLSSIAHNMHYKFEQGGMGPEEATDYAKRLLKMVGYPTDDVTLLAAIQAWQQLYPQDRLLDSGPEGRQLGETQPSAQTESWGYGAKGSKMIGFPEKFAGYENDLSQRLSNRPLYHWLDASDIHDWMDPSHTGPGQTYLTETGSDPSQEWNPDVPRPANPVRLTIDPSYLDQNQFDPAYEGWLGNHLYKGVIPPDAVSEIKAFRRPDEWDWSSTVPSEVNNPGDHWFPDNLAEDKEPKDHGVSFENDWVAPSVDY